MHIRIIVPECSFDALQGYLARIARLTGGYTSFKGQGGWVDDEGVLWSEPVTIVDAYWETSGQWQVQEEHLKLLCVDIANDLDQDCVYLSIDGIVQFVSGTKDIGTLSDIARQAQNEYWKK